MLENFFLSLDSMKIRQAVPGDVEQLLELSFVPGPTSTVA